MFTPDASQQLIINISSGHHLVLAPPGCGKTQILSERIRVAHQQFGVSYSDMLCLTFTNRAARGMAERIIQTIDDRDVNDVFVGNIHRFCIRMLTEHELIPSNTSIIDDDDALSILARLSMQAEEQVVADYKKSHELFDCIHFSQMMHQIRLNHPKEIRLHPECLNKDDMLAMQYICKAFNKQFTQAMMLNMYEHAEQYMDALKDMQTATYANYVVYRQQVENTLRKLSLAYKYEKYKEARNLMDFNEILLISYDILHEASVSDIPEQKEFLKVVQRPWIQVDEVQDLNPLQMAIIDLLSPTYTSDFTNHPLPLQGEGKSEIEYLRVCGKGQGRGCCVIYLGDSQQAIFSFMGAKLSTLDTLRQRCGENIHHLEKNHRSPKYLLDIYNMYAEKVLGIDKALLPQPTNGEKSEDALKIIYANTMDDEIKFVCSQAGDWLRTNPTETTAIITLSNNDADAISNQLDAFDLAHFKISGTDLFSTNDVKFLLAHFSAITADTNLISWSRILQATKCVHTAFEARDIVHQLIISGIAPSELLTIDSQDTNGVVSNHTITYTQRFAQVYETQDIVIFDTETTGLDTFRDDVIQIAAMRIKGEEILGSFMVHIETDREIPTMLGDIVNPIIEERKTAEILSHADALQRFADFAQGAVLLAHNADFDINILKSNLERYNVSIVNYQLSIVNYIDSLRLIRLLEPDLRVHKLKALLETLHLEGKNSHLADDDVNATKSLVDYCYRKAKEMEPHQNALLSRESIQQIARKLQRNYAPLYIHTKEALYVAGPHTTEAASAFTCELTYIHDNLVADSLIKPVEKLDYICSYLDNDLIDSSKYPELILQLQHYGAEINTLREADLCNSGRIKERIYVSTVHKAKGLEFDNVIVFDAVDGRYPNFAAATINQKEEDARKLYVAISRAKKRLYIGTCEMFINKFGRRFDRKITPFLIPVLKNFS